MTALFRSWHWLAALSVVSAPSCSSPQLESIAGQESERLGIQDGVAYEMWIRSFKDSDGDGVGDFRGAIEGLDYLADLGIGAVWLMPFYQSPLSDAGYDVADYRSVHTDYGTMADFDEFLEGAHDRGIRVLVDGVFNHTSSAHEWFARSVAGEEPFSEYYIWSDEPAFECGEFAGFNVAFGKDRWTWNEERGQYYFHNFKSTQPEINFESELAQQAILSEAAFWLDKGVDGFRLDVAHRYYQSEGTCMHHPDTPIFHKRLRELVDGYEDRVLVGEIFGDDEQVNGYLHSDGLHMALDPLLEHLPIRGIAGAIERFEELDALQAPGTALGVMMGNHDLPRLTAVTPLRATRNIWAALQLTLPGVPFLYYGEELGMSNGKLPGLAAWRDVARTPMPWTTEQHAGFSDCSNSPDDAPCPFLGLADDPLAVSVAAELEDESSTLHHYRRLIAIRNGSPALQRGSFEPLEVRSSVWLAAASAFLRSEEESGDARVVAFNQSLVAQTLTVPVPNGWQGPLIDDYSGQEIGKIENGTWVARLPGQSFAILRDGYAPRD